MSVWPEQPVLAGEHVTLRPLVRADREGLLAAFASGFDRIFTSPPPSEATFEAWFDAAEAQVAVGRAQVFTVLDSAGEIAGTTRYMRMNTVARRVEIGTTLYAPRVRRTGLNTQAKRLLLGHAFEGLGVHCVQIRTDVLNQTSRRAIERIGARMDGILRGHNVMFDPDYGERRRDTVVYSIIDIEWPAVKRHLDSLLAR